MDAAALQKAKNKKRRDRAKQKKKEKKDDETSTDTKGVAPTDEKKADLEAEMEEFKNLPTHKFFEDTRAKLVYTKKRGRHVVASEKIPAGEVVFEIPPYVAVVNDEMVDKFCHRCFRNAEVMYKCGACNHARFCSTQCMNAFSKTHLLECKTLTKLPELGIEGESAKLRMIIRVSYLNRQEELLSSKKPATAGAKKKTADLLFKPKPGLSFADAAGLISHEADFPSDHKALIMMALSKLEEAIDEDARLPLPIATKLLLQIQVNAHTIVGLDKTPIGLGLYPPASYVNHACRPSCNYFFSPNGVVTLRSIREIPPGHEVTYAYIDPYQSLRVRHQKLRDQYYIKKCLCARCAEPLASSPDRLLEGFTCPKCSEKKEKKETPDSDKSKDKKSKDDDDDEKEQKLTLTDEDRKAYEAHVLPVWAHDANASPDTKVACPTCKSEYKLGELKEVEKDAELLWQKALSMFKTGDGEEAGNFLVSKLIEGPPSKYLHPLHTLLFNSYLAMVGTCREQDNFTGQGDYCDRVIRGLEYCGLNNLPEHADAHFSLGESYVGRAMHCDEKISAILSGEDGDKEGDGDEKGEKDGAKGDKAEKNRQRRQHKKEAEKIRDDKEKLLKLALECYRKSLDSRTLCFGPKHDLTKSAEKRVVELAPKEIRKDKGVVAPGRKGRKK